jgi:hypothetical protein
VRNAGSTAAYDAYGSTAPFTVTGPSPPVVQSVAVNRTFPVAAGTTVTWTVTATGGVAPLQYKFWRLFGGTWRLARDYSTDGTFTWTSGAGDVGQHQLSIWVRNAGSTAAYDAYSGTAPFTVTGAAAFDDRYPEVRRAAHSGEADPVWRTSRAHLYAFLRMAALTPSRPRVLARVRRRLRPSTGSWSLTCSC